jgi:TonB family protein
MRIPMSLIAMLAIHTAAANEGPTVMKCTPTATAPRTDFPTLAQEMGLGGSLVIGLKLGVQGEVLSARVIRSSGRAPLDRAAVESAKRYWRFDIVDCSAEDLAREFRQTVTYTPTKGLPFSGAVNRRSLQRLRAVAGDERCALAKQSHETTVVACRRSSNSNRLATDAPNP